MTEIWQTQQALNKAMREAVDFIHAEGWDARPTLFALVPASLLIDVLDDESIAESPLALIPQDGLPDTILPGSEELGDYLSRVTWPEQVEGAVLAQEIMFTDTSSDNPEPRPARLFSGVLRGEPELTLIQLRPTEEEIEAAGPFAEDKIELRGGPSIAPGVIAVLRASFGAYED